ncbi:MAG: DUF3037 domain-containing protein [Actinomycetota bacterium]
MPDLHSFDYTIVRIVPRPERGECVNVGVILFCREANFLGGVIEPDWERVLVLEPEFDREEAARQLNHLNQVIDGSKHGGPIAEMPPSNRFHWLSGPRSTVIQVSPMHSGLCEDPAATLQRLARAVVE